MTVEAALAFPLFLLGITAFLWLFFLVQREVQTGRALTDAAREAAGMAYFAENRSGLEDNTCLLRLQDTYELRLPPGTDWFHPIRITQVRTVRGWVGFQGRQRIVSGDGEELVYVTDYGTVYHRELSCRHLKLSIRQEPLSQIGSLRNTNGAKYYPCELCWAGNGNTAYLTESGNRYHASLSCQGLVRGIHAVPLSQTGGLPPCSACGW